MSLKNNPTLKSRKVRVGITIGDPSGIGPAVTLKAIHKLNGLADFLVIADKWVLSRLSVIGYRLSDANIVDLDNVVHKNFKSGKVRAEYGKASIEYLEKALEMINTGEIDCLVTAPISKDAINKGGFKYTGHTEFLSERTGRKDLVMMLLNKRIKFSLVTRHIPLKNVSSQLSKNKLKNAVILTHESLVKLFSIKNPKIIVCALNPHASDNGLIGREENEIIRPVINKLKERIKNLSGPVSADVAILKALERQHDCVVAMYHDQALIPLKLTDKSSGVNITLGLSFVRTSPLHGAAFDIASNPALADPESMIEAIKLAIKCRSNLKEG